MVLDPHMAILAASIAGVGFLMSMAGLQKSALEWRRRRRICPSCGTELVTGSEQGMLYCPNFDCPARQLEGLVHFASRNAMDIRGLSYARIRQFVDANLVHDPSDLYDLTAGQLVALERLAEKSAWALVQAIEASKAQRCQNYCSPSGSSRSERSRPSR